LYIYYYTDIRVIFEEITKMKAIIESFMEIIPLMPLSGLKLQREKTGSQA